MNEMTPVPTIGRIVHYRLDEHDAESINRRRAHATAHAYEHRDRANGVQVHTGNSVKSGDVFPMVITRVWDVDDPIAAVNGQVLLDGNDTLWVSSVRHGDGPREYTWPQRA